MISLLGCQLPKEKPVIKRVYEWQQPKDNVLYVKEDSSRVESPTIDRMVHEYENGVLIRTSNYPYYTLDNQRNWEHNENEFIHFIDGWIIANSEIPKFNTTITAQVIVDENGEEAKEGELLTFEFTVIKNPIPAESVEAFTSVSWVEAGDGMALNSRLLPQNASYKKVTFQIEFVIVDNQKITDQDKIKDYAEIDTSSGSIDSATLLTKKTLSAGDKIAISAYAPCDDIHSQTPAEIEVVAEPPRP